MYALKNVALSALKRSDCRCSGVLNTLQTWWRDYVRDSTWQHWIGYSGHSGKRACQHVSAFYFPRFKPVDSPSVWGNPKRSREWARTTKTCHMHLFTILANFLSAGPVLGPICSEGEAIHRVPAPTASTTVPARSTTQRTMLKQLTRTRLFRVLNNAWATASAFVPTLKDSQPDNEDWGSRVLASSNRLNAIYEYV